MKKCVECKKLHNNKKCCSNDCRLIWLHNYCKKNKKSFWNEKTQSMNGKATHKKHPNQSSITLKRTHKKYPNLARDNGKAAQKTLRRLEVGAFHDPKLRKEICSKGGNAVSFETHSKAGKIGGVNSQKILRRNIRNLKFKRQFYDSPDEIEVSICLQEQYKYNPKEGINLHICMKGGEIDFLLENLKLFVEEHRYFRNETLQQYTKRRRKILDENDYEDYKLIVIT